MKAVRVLKNGDSTELHIQDVPKPSVGAEDVLVKIRASFVQPADILNSKGGFPMTTFPRTIGKDFAGTVVEGPSDWIGQDVYGTSGSTFGFTEDGAQAEYAVLKVNAVAVKPTRLSFAQAAAVGTPWSTGMMTLLRARATAADTVMVLGATGSVGSSVMQIAAKLGCKTIGVGHHGTDIDSSQDPQLHEAKDLTGGAGPDVVVDTVGDLALIKAAFEVMAVRGRLSIISAPRQGNRELPLDLLSLYRRQVELVGCNSAAYSQMQMATMLKDLAPDFDSGKFVAPDEKSMSLISIDQAPDAYSGKTKRAVIVFD